MNLLYANDRPGEYPPSWYADSLELPKSKPALKGEVKADLCVVGGGYTGLSAALHAAEAGLEVVLVEAQRVGFGASGRNGGQLGTGWRKSQSWLERHLGTGKARQLWEMAEEAKALTRDLIDRHAPEADYRPGIVHADWHASEVRDSHAEARHLAHTYGYHQIEALDREALREIVRSDAYQGGYIDHGAGHIQPLTYALGLARAAEAAGVRIFERSAVHHIDRKSPAVVRTDRGRVVAQHVILGLNGYHGGLDRKIAARVMPINNFIVATEPLDDIAAVLARPVAVADSRFVVNYFRPTADGRLLFGGGESYGYRFPSDIRRVVSRHMLEVFPQLDGAELTHAWGGTLAITTSRLPCFTRLAANVVAAGGFSGHGVALAGFAGKVMAEAVTATADRFDLLTALPARPFPGAGVLRTPLLALGMTWFALRDRLGI